MINTNFNRPNIVRQAGLGRVKDVYKPSSNMGGQLSLAKVTAVNHKYGSCDVQIIKNNAIISSSQSTEGKYSARIATATAYYNPDTLESSGVTEPYQVGQLVLLAFLDESSSKPIILSSFHNVFDITTNVLPDYYPLQPTLVASEFLETLKYLRVFPSQVYTKVDGVGGIEFSHPSKTFLKIDNGIYLPNGLYMTDDRDTGIDQQDLSEKDPITLETRSGKTEEEGLPINLLFVHRSNFFDADTTWTKFFISKDGDIRVLRDTNTENLSYFQIAADGAMKFRRQLDSHTVESGSNYSEVSIDEVGNVLTQNVSPSGTSAIKVGCDGSIEFSRNGTSFGFDTDGNIRINLV